MALSVSNGHSDGGQVRRQAPINHVGGPEHKLKTGGNVV